MEQKKGKKFCHIKKSLYFCTAFERKCLRNDGVDAEIAQLVEHNLAKVGVAGPSPVFRSDMMDNTRRWKPFVRLRAQVAEW